MFATAGAKLMSVSICVKTVVVRLTLATLLGTQCYAKRSKNVSAATPGLLAKCSKNVSEATPEFIGWGGEATRSQIHTTPVTAKM